MIYTDCVNCNAGIVADEPNACVLCGRDLCGYCYDSSPYCKACDAAQQELSTLPSDTDESDIHSGECVVCNRYSSQLSLNNICEGCVLQAMIEQQGGI